MGMTDRDEQDLILHVSGLADGETARRAEALLAESSEARAYVDEIRHLKCAIGPGPADEIPLTEAEMAPWLQMAQQTADRTRPAPVATQAHRLPSGLRWLAPFAAAAVVAFAVGMWARQDRASTEPVAQAPVGYIEQIDGGGTLAIPKISKSSLLGNETIRLVDQCARLRVGGWTGWLAINSECVLSERGTKIKLIRGSLIVEMNEGAAPLQIAAQVTTANVEPGLLNLTILPLGDSWTCYTGHATIWHKGGTVSLEPGRSVGVLIESGEVLEKPSHWPRPRWIEGLNKDLDHFGRHAEGSESSP